MVVGLRDHCGYVPSSRAFCQSKTVHENGLIGFAIGIIAALVTEDVNLSFAGLKASWVIATPVRLAQASDRHSMPGLALILSVVNAVRGDVKHRTFTSSQKLGVSGMFERGAMVLVNNPDIGVLAQQTLPARFA